MKYGSLNNLLTEQYIDSAPAVGMPCTELGWTDRNPYTVIGVKGKTRIVVTIQECNAVRTDTLGMTDSGQQYDITPNPNGRIQEVTFRRGKWQTRGGSTVKFGHADKYHDFSF